MWFFNRKKKTPIEPILIEPPLSSRVEIELHKNASEEAAHKAQEANQHINDLLVENGFTLKIFLAAGGRLPPKSKKKGAQ